MGVSETEGVALFNSIEEAIDLFKPGKFGLARQLNPEAFYCAMAWSYDLTPKPLLRMSHVMISHGIKKVMARPVDWGPHPRLNRLVDASPAVLRELGVQTDDVVKCTLMIPKL